MKKSVFAVLIALTLFVTSAFAIETTSGQSVTATSSNADLFSKAFHLTVTQDKTNVQAGQVFSEGDVTGLTLPYLISNPKPIVYPRWAVQQGWQGDFAIALEVLADGSLGRYMVMHSTGHKILDDAATKAVLAWSFHPAMKNGNPIVECVQIPVRFQLQAE